MFPEDDLSGVEDFVIALQTLSLNEPKNVKNNCIAAAAAAQIEIMKNEKRKQITYGPTVNNAAVLSDGEKIDTRDS